MNVHLILPEGREKPAPLLLLAKDSLLADLELNKLLDAVAQNDKVIRASLVSALFSPLQDLSLLKYRHDVLKDVYAHPDVVRALYDLCLEAERRRKSTTHWMTNYYLSTTFSGAIEYLINFTETLLKLRQQADTNAKNFSSVGFTDLFQTLQTELPDSYLNQVRSQLSELNSQDGTLVSARLGSYLQGTDYVLHRREKKRLNFDWLKAQTYKLGEKDDPGSADMGARQDRAINEVTNALAQAAEHLASFFDVLRSELAFYVGCLNLTELMKQYGMYTCLPELTEADGRTRIWEGMFDISLVITKKSAVTANNLTAEGKKLFIVTGANQGGKSTFLRSFGQAQLMAQCGMPVGAKRFVAPLRSSIYSHFKKEEDAYMKSGKLDEELERMSRIANYIKPGDLLLFNEAFSSTNEREGSEIGRQITEALIQHDIEVFSVSHLHAYAIAFENRPEVQYLRAQRLDDGKRTFTIIPGEPLETAFGEDLYNKIFKGASI